MEVKYSNRLTGSFCTTSSKPATCALATGVQFPNAFSDPTVLYADTIHYGMTDGFREIPHPSSVADGMGVPTPIRHP